MIHTISMYHDTYYFNVSIIKTDYNNDYDYNINTTVINSYREKFDPKDKKIYFKINILKDFDKLKPGILISNFIKIENRLNGLVEEDFDEITPYMLAPIFTNPFYRFSELYESYKFFTNITYTDSNTIEKDYSTKILRAEPYFNIMLRNFSLNIKLIYTNVNYDYTFSNSDYPDTTKHKGKYTDIKTTLDINYNLPNDYFFNNINIKSKLNIISRIEETREIYSADFPENIKGEYGYNDIGIELRKKDKLSYYLALRILKGKINIERINSNTSYGYNNIYMMPFEVSSDNTTENHEFFFSKFNIGTEFRLIGIDFNIETGLIHTEISDEIHTKNQVYGSINLLTTIFKDINITIGYKHSYLFNSSYIPYFSLNSSSFITFVEYNNNTNNPFKGIDQHTNQVTLSIEYKF
ncbi:MAG TPA: hypothetical protein PKW55_07095 [Spirochaetota bacterium]|nr:hypothetical protein [Spirochaetota bacterium]HOM38718.1 hypothetical protein [Spirochaetota bacterium]HPQ49515.1 hypothetical protein [Spirochaetota bacterium]